MPEPVVKSITVPCAPARAYALFTTEIASWWPLDKNSVSAMSGKVAQNIVVDVREGGEIWEIDFEGTQVLWGSFAKLSPGQHLRINWHIGTSPDQATTVDVAFLPAGRGTKVVLTHSGWEVLGHRGEEMRKNYDSGWVYVFEDRFAAACRT